MICGHVEVPLFIDASFPTHLVLKVNLDLLLRGRDNLVLGFALEVGEVGHGLLDDVEGLLDLLLGDDKGRSKANDVLVGRFGLENISQRSPKQI